MNNNKQCPICRSLLTSLNCKKCGYQQKKLKIVQSNEQFRRLSYTSKIQSGQQDNKISRKMTGEEKLKLYLRQYVKLLKSSTGKLAVAHNLSFEQTKQLNQQVFYIWKNYAIKRKQMNLSFAGIFKKYISAKIKQNKIKKQVAKINQHESQNKSEKQLDSSQQEGIPDKKRLNLQQQQKQVQSRLSFNTKHKFRSYFLVTVKPLINASIQQRKTDSSIITTCQKSFLSYLLAIQQGDSDFLRICSEKYLKMLLNLQGKSNQKSFIRDSDIKRQLLSRNINIMKRKDESILLILFIDLLLCVVSEISQIREYQFSLFIKIYEESQKKYYIIDKIIQSLNSNNNSQNPNIPGIKYELIYSIINLAAVKIGLCLSIPQVIVGIGPLKIGAVQIDDQVIIQGVANQQSINTIKVRKTSHQLASFLSYNSLTSINKWSNKWCNKFGLANHSRKVSMMNQLIFKQLSLPQNTLERGQFSEQGKLIKYKRHLWLEQDIVSLAGIMVFLKLSTGLTSYPYLVNFPVQQVQKSVSIQNESYNMIKALMSNKQLVVQNKQVQLVKTIFIPQIYKNHFDILHFSKVLTSISNKDKYFQLYSFNRNSIRFRNLHHLNGVDSNSLLIRLQQMKSDRLRLGGRSESQYEVQIKYDEHLHKQFVRQICQKNKKVRLKKGLISKFKPIKQLNCNLIRQINYLVSQNQKVSLKKPVISEECRIDEPSSNYEIIYEYSLDNLLQSKRQQQLYFMEGLCSNICSFSQFGQWLNRYQSILKIFQTQ